MSVKCLNRQNESIASMAIQIRVLKYLAPPVFACAHAQIVHSAVSDKSPCTLMEEVPTGDFQNATG